MRVFIGLPLDSKTKNLIEDISFSLEHKCPGAYVDSSLYHLTLAFIGDVEAKDLDKLEKVIKKTCENVGKFELELSHLGFFAHVEKAILHCAIKPSIKLEELARKLYKNLKEEKIEFDDKTFRAHITLGRRVNISNVMLKKIKLPEIRFQADSVVLFESTRIDGVLTYVPLIKTSL